MSTKSVHQCGGHSLAGGRRRDRWLADSNLLLGGGPQDVQLGLIVRDPSSTATRAACPAASYGQFRLPGPPPDDLMGLGLDVARVAASHEDFERVPGRSLGYRMCFGQSAGRRQQPMPFSLC